MNILVRKIAAGTIGLLLTSGTVLANQASNENTGFNSKNNSSIEESNKTDIESENETDLYNKVMGKLSTGRNRSNYNTGNAEIDTGDADGKVTVKNRANENKLRVNGSGNNGSWTIKNSQTGANSKNNAWVKMNNSLKLENENEARVSNCIKASASTGGNKANYNTGNASVETGDSSLEISVENTLNSNDTTVE